LGWTALLHAYSNPFKKKMIIRKTSSIKNNSLDPYSNNISEVHLFELFL